MKSTPISDETYSYICRYFSSEDDFLRSLNDEAESLEIPPIQVSPDQLTFLQVFLQGMSAKYVLEIGSLAGYSSIGMARALPEDGKVVALEINAQYADFIRKKAEKAGVSDKIEVHVGAAARILSKWKPDFLFDFVFIDADKPNYVNYLDLVYPLLRKGGIIAGDNALAWGEIANEQTDREDVQGMQAFNKKLSADKRFQSCLLPIGDGMAIGVKL